MMGHGALGGGVQRGDQEEAALHKLDALVSGVGWQGLRARNVLAAAAGGGSRRSLVGDGIRIAVRIPLCDGVLHHVPRRRSERDDGRLAGRPWSGGAAGMRRLLPTLLGRA